MKKIKNNIHYKKKLKILEKAKIIVRKDGWSKNIFSKLITKDISFIDLNYLFPDVYKELLIFAIDEINIILKNKTNKKNIINFSISQRIKKILMSRIEIINEDKIFYKKTFNHLLIPQNSNVMKKSLYNTVDTMWYLAGDNSTDFSFYTKRITLAIIYINALIILYNRGFEESEKNINKNLYRISKIPKIKNRFLFIKENLPVFLKSF